MTPKTLAETIAERIDFIGPVVDKIQQGGRESDLRDLKLLLLDTMGLLRRDPGIEAAAEDLFQAAAAFVSDRPAGTQPMARKLRLVRSAHTRLRERLTGAAERVGPRERPRLHGLAALYAAQLALGTAVAGMVGSSLRIMPTTGG